MEEVCIGLSLIATSECASSIEFIVLWDEC